jgi:hypothetical protein
MALQQTTNHAIVTSTHATSNTSSNPKIIAGARSINSFIERISASYRRLHCSKLVQGKLITSIPKKPAAGIVIRERSQSFKCHSINRKHKSSVESTKSTDNSTSSISSGEKITAQVSKLNTDPDDNTTIYLFDDTIDEILPNKPISNTDDSQLSKNEMISELPTSNNSVISYKSQITPPPQLFKQILLADDPILQRKEHTIASPSSVLMSQLPNTHNLDATCNQKSLIFSPKVVIQNSTLNDYLGACQERLTSYLEKTPNDSSDIISKPEEPEDSRIIFHSETHPLSTFSFFNQSHLDWKINLNLKKQPITHILILGLPRNTYFQLLIDERYLTHFSTKFGSMEFSYLSATDLQTRETLDNLSFRKLFTDSTFENYIQQIPSESKENSSYQDWIYLHGHQVQVIFPMLKADSILSKPLSQVIGYYNVLHQILNKDNCITSSWYQYR